MRISSLIPPSTVLIANAGTGITAGREEPGRGDMVGERDPREVLLSGAQRAAEAEPDDWLQTLHEITGRRQHRAAAQVHYSHAGGHRRVSSALPEAA
jgi:hypothetical protein